MHNEYLLTTPLAPSPLSSGATTVKYPRACGSPARLGSAALVERLAAEDNAGSIGA